MLSSSSCTQARKASYDEVDIYVAEITFKTFLFAEHQDVHLSQLQKSESLLSRHYPCLLFLIKPDLAFGECSTEVRLAEQRAEEVALVVRDFKLHIRLISLATRLLSAKRPAGAGEWLVRFL
jgi:hypothetical protein